MHPSSSPDGVSATDAASSEAPLQPGSEGDYRSLLKRLASTAHIREHFQSVAQTWLNLPHTFRIFVMSAGAFSVLLLLFVVHLSITAAHDAELRGVRERAVFVRQMLNVAAHFAEEGEATVLFSASLAPWMADEMLAARHRTDAAVSELRGFFHQHREVLAQPLTDDAHLPSLESELGQQRLIAIRQQVIPQVVMINTTDLIPRFGQLVQRLVQYAAQTTVQILLEHEPLLVQLQLVLLSHISVRLHRARVLAASLTDPHAFGALPAGRQREAALRYAVEMRAVEHLVVDAFEPLLPEEAAFALRVRLASVRPITLSDNLAETIMNHHLRIRAGFGGPTLCRPHDLPSSVPAGSDKGNNTAESAELLSILRRHAAGLETDLDLKLTFWFVRNTVLASFCVAVLVLYLSQYVHNRVVNAERDRIELRNAAVMHDVLVRVQEFADSFATFRLDPGVPPRVMQGTHCGTLEAKLQDALASLRALAGTLPPLLLPGYFRALATAQLKVKGAVKDQQRRIALADQRRKRQRLDLLPADADAMKSADVEAMEEVTRLREEAIFGAFVTVDLSGFHSISTNDGLNLAEEAYAKLIAVIESVVYQCGGILHAVYADRAVASWGTVDAGASASNSYSSSSGGEEVVVERATTCALALAARMNGLRKLNKALREALPVRIGITAGAVRKGVFGSPEAKSLLLFGPPLLDGIEVARSNRHHMSCVACDETVQRAVTFVCKPIELINSGCSVVYEVLNEAAVRAEVDIETRLGLYRKAFALYQKNCYREALRVFRAYTKQYGYDCSVERIQTIITGV